MKKLNLIDFEAKLLECNPYFNSYFKIIGDFKNCRTKIEVETPYGKCLVSPYSLLEGNKPSIQTAIDKTGFFVNLAKEIHGNTYDYSSVKYSLNNSKVTIICPTHGKFNQRPNNHLSGNGCPKCNVGGWDFKLDSWLNTKNSEATFYILKCYSDDEEFIKIGITSESIKERYRKKNYMPYKFEIIHQTTSTNKQLIWEIERNFLTKFKANRYAPKIDFGGKTECFDIKVLEKFV